MNETASFGAWIKRRRSALLLSREDLARQVGCAVVTLRKIEADERRPSQQIAERLEQRDCRLLTLVGPGGIGKTRLALEAVINLGGAFPNGVYFVPPAALDSAALLVPAIAGALGFTFHGTADPKAQLIAYLRGQEILLVLDNFEQLLTGANVLIDLIQAAPGVKLLATSREPLHLRVEWLLDVQELPVPAHADDAAVEQSSAVRLFTQTANRMRANFALSLETIPS